MPLLEKLVLRLRIAWLRHRHRPIQLWVKEIVPVACAIRRWPRCRLLVFGVGHDTPLWLALNREGRTAFIEDDPGWIARTAAECPRAEVHRVVYPTSLSRWPEELERARIELPAAITGEPWDVILVDAPSGDLESYFRAHGREPPGRACSIAAARRLIRPGGDVFVHDCERPAEDGLTRRVFAPDELAREVRGRALLRHYRVRKDVT